jgi:hypothetical protein
MKNSTICFIVDFDEFTRQACIEALPGNSYSTITVEEKGKRMSKQAWTTTIEFARTIRSLGQQGKQMNFKVVIARSNGVLRYARPSEWIISQKQKRSFDRAVSLQLAKLQAKKRLVRGRLGLI